MNTSTSINVLRPAPVRGGGCGLDVQPNPVSAIEAAETARLFAALADPTRLRILALLAAQPAPLCACEIGPAFAQGQPTIAHHLKVLREAGLVRWEKRGLWVYYAPDRERLQQVAAVLTTLHTTGARASDMSSTPGKGGDNDATDTVLP